MPNSNIISSILLGLSKKGNLHNHPSGRLSPSKADKEITNRMDSCTKQMDIELLDHLIITRDGHYSLRDEGFLKSAP